MKKIIKPKKKVAIAMSGGVDSAIAAALLKKQGYDCLGIFLKFWHEPNRQCQQENKCCSTEAYLDAKAVAGKLGIKLYTLNFEKPFKEKVVNDFLKKYEQGFTPNPCIKCNQFIKLGLLLKKTKLLGCDYLATGHYAKKIKVKNQKSGPQYRLYQALDKQKDQSYFLYNLTQRQLKYLLFPLANLTKSRVRILAKKMKLPIYQKAESQEICFIPEKNHYPFLRRQLRLTPGPIKDVTGKILGRHEGLPLYTLGQRQGIKIGGHGPYYVVELNKKNNALIVSNNHDDQRLYIKKFKIKNINWLSGQPPLKTKELGVKIRYQAKTIPATINKNIVTLKTPARAVMPGQSAVFYLGQMVIGGGIIN